MYRRLKSASEWCENRGFSNTFVEHCRCADDSERIETADKMLTIACKEQSIQILEIQKEGKSRQQIDQFLLGNNIKMGESID